MADFSIVFGAGQLALAHLRKPQLTKLDTLEIDCTLSETQAYEADVTEFEVERGANITDHRRVKLVEITIAGVVSDTPIDRSLVREAVLLAAGPLGVLLDAADTAQNLLADDAVITRDAFDKLLDLFNNGSRASPNPDGTFTVVTKYRTFDKMVFKSLRFTRDGHTGYALPFSATFKEIRTVETGTISVTAPTILQAPSPFGNGSPDAASPALRDKSRSMLLQGFNAAGEDPLSEVHQQWRMRFGPIQPGH